MTLRLIILLTLAASMAQAQDRFVGVAFNQSRLFLYALESSGEIGSTGQTSLLTGSELIRVDSAGRFALTVRGPDPLDCWRITESQTLSLASSSEAEGTGFFYGDVALSEDGRVALVSFVDAGVTPYRVELWTFLVNNRLQVTHSGSAFPLSESEFRGIVNWGISARIPYIALVNNSAGGFQQLAVLSISATGEITDTGQRLATPGLLNVPFDISPDGRWAISGGNTDVVLFEIHPDGTVTLEDTFDPNGPVIGPNCLRFTPNLNQILIAPLVDTVESLAFDETTLLGSVIDSAETGFGLPEALAVNAAGTMVLVDDQSAGGQFSLASVFLSPDGTLTPTGHTLPKGFKLADLQFIPPRALPSLPGDANLDGVVDAADIVFLVNEAMPDDKPILLPPNFANADLDQDVDVDQDDLEALVAMLVGE